VRSTSEASRSAAEVRATGQGSSSERVGPTAALGRATGGSAASAQDVRLQQQGQPTRPRPRKTVRRRRPWERTSCRRWRPILIARAVWMGRATADAWARSMTPGRIWQPIEEPSHTGGVPVWLTPLLRPAGGCICPGSIYRESGLRCRMPRRQRRRRTGPHVYVTRSSQGLFLPKADLAFAAFRQLLLRRNPVVDMKAARLTLLLPHFVSTPANARLSLQMPRQLIIFGGIVTLTLNGRPEGLYYARARITSCAGHTSLDLRHQMLRT
jgi:hypothetical protein